MRQASSHDLNSTTPTASLLYYSVKLGTLPILQQLTSNHAQAVDPLPRRFAYTDFMQPLRCGAV